MVRRRFVDTAKRIARRQDLALHDAKIGEARFSEALASEQLDTLRIALERNGFEILETRQVKLIESIKQVLCEVIEEPEIREGLNLSAILSKRLNYEYSHLSKLFSGSEGITIEQYFIQQWLDKAKELLAYGTLPITQIAEDLRFNSRKIHF